jgi:hypothetical protein
MSAPMLRAGVEAGIRAFLYGYAGRELAMSVVLQPAVFTFIVVSTAASDDVLRLALGAGLFSVWAMAMGAAAGGLWGERLHGRLLVVSAAPVTVTSVLSGFVIASMTLSTLAFASVLAVLSLMGAASLAPLLSMPVLAAIALHLLAMGIISVSIAPLFAVSEAALQTVNPLLYAYAICAAFFTTGAEPVAGASWVGWPFPSYWASRALSAGLTGDPESWWLLLAGAGLCVVYAIAARALLRWVGRAIRVTGSVAVS